MTETQTVRREIVPNAIIPRVWCAAGRCHASAEGLPREEAKNWRCPQHRVMGETVRTEVLFEGVPMSEHPAFRARDARPADGSQAIWKDETYVVVATSPVQVKLRKPRGKKEFVVKFDDTRLLHEKS